MLRSVRRTCTAKVAVRLTASCFQLTTLHKYHTHTHTHTRASVTKQYNLDLTRGGDDLRLGR